MNTPATFTPTFDSLIDPIKQAILDERDSAQGGCAAHTTAQVFGLIWRNTQKRYGVCFASQETMAKQLGICTRTLRRHIRRLEVLGYIVDTTPDLRNRSHRYCITEAGYALLEKAEKTHRTQFNSENLSDSSDSVASEETQYTTTKNTESKPKQLTLIQNDHHQNLNALDIEYQKNLATFNIHPHLTQVFANAPTPMLIQRHSPAEVLMFHDPEGTIAANLDHWRQAWDAGQADLTGLNPALIWCKIVEGQAPPQKPPAAPPGIIQAAEAVIAESAAAGIVLPAAQDLAGDDLPDWAAKYDNSPPPDNPPASPLTPEPSPPEIQDQDHAAAYQRVKENITHGGTGLATHLKGCVLRAVDVTQNRFTIAVPGPNSLSWLKGRCRPIMARELARHLGIPPDRVTVEFVFNEPIPHH